MISGLGPHRSGRCGFAIDEPLMMVLIEAISAFKGVELPKEAMINDNFKESA